MQTTNDVHYILAIRNAKNRNLMKLFGRGSLYSLQRGNKQFKPNGADNL